MKSWNLIWKKQTNFSQLEEITADIYCHLKNKAPFCLWLEGALGAGKTTFTKQLFYTMGLASSTSVNSPTYTYLLEYQIKNKWYGHLDFYRADTTSKPEMQSLLGLKEYHGFVIEWPKKISADESIEPTHLLQITEADNFDSRVYSFYEKS
jgi:tRNA threonylcarbamoyladenosine biosynthesis protein TsaE|tara:strand:+ start:79 stop:531 length:453 start_codon:yes stop_codon:yes gene_type:complete